MTLVVSQSGSFAGGANPSTTVTPSGGTSPKAIIVGYSSGGGVSGITYGGVTLTGLVTAYGGISSTDVAMAYLLDISGRASDTLTVNNGGNGNGSAMFWILIEGDDPQLLAKAAMRTTAANYSVTSPSPTVAGGHAVGLLSRVNYSPAISAGTGMTQLYAGKPKREAWGGYRIGAVDSTLTLSVVHGSPTGGWGASAYVFLEEQSVVTPNPPQAIVIAS